MIGHLTQLNYGTKIPWICYIHYFLYAYIILPLLKTCRKRITRLSYYNNIIKNFFYKYLLSTSSITGVSRFLQKNGNGFKIKKKSEYSVKNRIKTVYFNHIIWPRAFGKRISIWLNILYNYLPWRFFEIYVDRMYQYRCIKYNFWSRRQFKQRN